MQLVNAYRLIVALAVALAVPCIAVGTDAPADVIFLNVSMPVLSGLAAAREIKAKLPKCAIIILSSDVDRRFVEEARKIGTHAYVSKTRAATELVKTIEAAMRGADFVVMD